MSPSTLGFPRGPPCHASRLTHGPTNHLSLSLPWRYPCQIRVPPHGLRRLSLHQALLPPRSASPARLPRIKHSAVYHHHGVTKIFKNTTQTLPAGGSPLPCPHHPHGARRAPAEATHAQGAPAVLSGGHGRARASSPRGGRDPGDEGTRGPRCHRYHGSRRAGDAGGPRRTAMPRAPTAPPWRTATPGRTAPAPLGCPPEAVPGSRKALGGCWGA